MCGSFKYLPIELFVKKYCSLIFPASSKMELEIFISKFLDINQNKIFFQDEFYEVLELNLRSILSVMKTLNIGVEPEKAKKDNNNNNSLIDNNSNNSINKFNNNSILNIIDENALKMMNSGKIKI